MLIAKKFGLVWIVKKTAMNSEYGNVDDKWLKKNIYIFFDENIENK